MAGSPLVEDEGPRLRRGPPANTNPRKGARFGMRSVDDTGKKHEQAGDRRWWPLVGDIARAAAAIAMALAAIGRLFH